MRTPHSAQRTDSENSTRSSGSLGTSNRRSSRFEDAREDREVQEVRRLLDQDEALTYSQMLEYGARGRHGCRLCTRRYVQPAALRREQGDNLPFWNVSHVVQRMFCTLTARLGIRHLDRLREER